MARLLTEITAAEQAKAMGLVYLGFGGWGRPNDRQVIARTVDGHLVRVDEDPGMNQHEDLGRIIIIDFDDELLYRDLQQDDSLVDKYIKLFKALVKTGNDVVILHARNSKEHVAKWLKKIGVVKGPTLVPYGSSDPEKKRKFVRQKIKQGYKEIEFFDRDPKTIRAVESLEAPFNKLQIKIDTHQLPRLDYDPEKRDAADSEDGNEKLHPVSKGSWDIGKGIQLTGQRAKAGTV